jgi:hypothetical protein
MSQWRQLFASGPARLFLSDAPQAFQVDSGLPLSLPHSFSQGIVINEIVTKPSSLPHANSGETANPPSPQLPPAVPLSVTSAPSQIKSKIDSSRKPEPPLVVQSQATRQDQKSPSNIVLVQVPLGATPGTSVRVPGPDGNSVSPLSCAAPGELTLDR